MVRKLVNNFIHTYAAPPSPFVRGGGRLILEEKKFCQKLSEMAQKLVKLLFDTMTNDQDGGCLNGLKWREKTGQITFMTP